jgi:hypothetical protein
MNGEGLLITKEAEDDPPSVCPGSIAQKARLSLPVRSELRPEFSVCLLRAGEQQVFCEVSKPEKLLAIIYRCTAPAGKPRGFSLARPRSDCSYLSPNFPWLSVRNWCPELSASGISQVIQ